MSVGIRRAKIRTTGGEGVSAREALEALAFSLRDEEVDEDKKIVVSVRRALPGERRPEGVDDWFVAEVQR